MGRTPSPLRYPGGKIRLANFGLSRNCRDLGIAGGGCKEAIAMQVQIDTLEQML